MADTPDAGTRPAWKRALGWVLTTIVIAAVAFGLLRVFIPPVAPGATPPEGHFSASCGYCHIVSSAVGNN